MGSGNLSRFPKLPDLIAELEASDSSLTPFPCVVLRNITTEIIDAYLRYEARRAGWDVRLCTGGFDNMVQDILEKVPAEVWAETKAILVFLFQVEFGGRSPAGEGDLEKGYLEKMDFILRALHLKSAAPVFWIFDDLRQMQNLEAHEDLAADCRQLASQAAQLALNYPGCRFVNLSSVRTRTGSAGFYDARLWHTARNPLSRTGWGEVAVELAKGFRSISGRGRKALILDCDQVLWGGIVGEDGVEGIRIGEEYPGNAYRAFQALLLSLKKNGILLGLCSKNNETDVQEVFRERPEMLLRWEDFAATRVNWQDKAANLQSLSKETGISLDAMSFADDSTVEVEWVRQAVPSVCVIPLDPQKPEEHGARILRWGDLWVGPATEEGTLRAQHPKAEIHRANLAKAAPSMEEFLRNLALKARFEALQPKNLERAVELLARTNQFNLTGYRPTLEQFAQRMTKGEIFGWLCHLEDRYGDYGKIALCVFEKNNAGVKLENYAVSCRALGRGLEFAFLTKIAAELRAMNIRTVEGTYVPTHKNTPALEFLQKTGWPLQETKHGTQRFLWEKPFLLQQTAAWIQA